MMQTVRERAIEALHPRSLKYLSRDLKGLVASQLWLQVVVAMVLGLMVGVLLGPSTGLVAPETALVVTNWLALPGRLFLALIQMIVIPLVFASIVRGLAASEDMEQLKKVGTVVVVYFVVTTAIAIIIGLGAAYIIEPGYFIDSDMVRASLGQTPSTAGVGSSLPSLGQLPQVIVGILPSNPLTSMVESEMLQIVIFAIVIGAALVMMAPTQAKPLLELLGTVQEVCMTVVRWAMRLAPFAVFGLLTQLTAKIGLEALFGMAVYVATVLAGLLTLMIMYIILAAVAGRQPPGQFIRVMRDLVLLAFSTSSSAAVMPLSIKTAEEQLHVRSSIAQFVIPLGATLNMNGTALYQGVATIFLAQVFGIDLSIGALALVIVTAVGASIGSPATPGVGIVILAMVLTSVGIPPAGIGLIMGVDRILDMSRTAANVTGDVVAAVLMDRWVGGSKPRSELAETDAKAARLGSETGETVLVED